MDKQEFLRELRVSLRGLPQEDIEERLSFYAEMIDDRVEEGLTEQEAVAAIGSVAEVAAQIIGDTPLTKIVKENLKPRRRLGAGELVLLVLGSPIWLAVVLSLYVSLWAVIASVWSVFAALIGSALGTLVGGVLLLCNGNTSGGLACMAGGLVCAGLSIFAFFGCKAATKGTLRLTKAAVLAVKKRCVRKEAAE